ncbi:MAG: cysteine hydrolase family protein [Lachnospiraceae bacterium]
MKKNIVPLIVIDMQKAFLHPSWGKRNNVQAEENIVCILKHWRTAGQPIIFVQHESDNQESLFYKGKATFEFMDNIVPKEHEHVLIKKVNSAFIGTDLESRLKTMGCSCLVIVGLTTNHCVETTARMAGNLGFNPILVSDACATFDRIGLNGQMYSAELIHEMTLVNLNQEFARIMDTDTVLKMI